MYVKIPFWNLPLKVLSIFWLRDYSAAGYVIFFFMHFPVKVLDVLNFERY